MKYMQMKYMWLALAAPLFLTACTEEDDHASVPEYTKFDYPEWAATARPEIALPPTYWTVAFGGGVDSEVLGLPVRLSLRSNIRQRHI